MNRPKVVADELGQQKFIVGLRIIARSALQLAMRGSWMNRMEDQEIKNFANFQKACLSILFNMRKEPS